MKPKILSLAIIASMVGGLYYQQSFRRDSISDLFLDGGLALAQNAENREDYSTPYPTECEEDLADIEEPRTLHGQGCVDVKVYQEEICVEILCN